MTKLNTGLSGCSLELINDRVLRKYSPTTDYNSRLLSQADKQVVFGNRIYKNIDAPKVYDMQKNYFDMEYIAGKSFEEFFSSASVNDVEFVATVEEADWTGIVAQVAAVALVHLKLIATGHVAQEDKDQGSKGHTRDEHSVGQLGVERLRVLVVAWVFDVRVGRAT